MQSYSTMKFSELFYMLCGNLNPVIVRDFFILYRIGVFDMKRKTVVLIGALALMLSGCGAVKETSDGTEVQKEPRTEESTVVETTDELIDSDRFEGEISTIEALSQNESEAESMEYALIDESAYSECELSDKDFEVVYKGYTIDGQTTAEDIKKNLGLPEDFEDNHEGYITTVDQEWRWMIRYPNFSESSDIKVIFYTNLDTDETQIKSVELYNSETYRGLKVGDSIKDIYEEYGLPTEKESYGEDHKDLELRYIKDNQRLSFGVDQKSQMIKYIHIGYNLSEDER